MREKPQCNFVSSYGLNTYAANIAKGIYFVLD